MKKLVNNINQFKGQLLDKLDKLAVRIINEDPAIVKVSFPILVLLFMLYVWWEVAW